MAHEPTPWNPPGVRTLSAPPARAHEGLRWRPARSSGEDLQDKPSRTRRAVAEQCLNARVPGYTGFIPSARAEDVCGKTQATVGRHALREQERRRDMRDSGMLNRSAPEEGVFGRKTFSTVEGFPDDHPLGRSKAKITRNHWVPTIPGYGGFCPAKEAENICGGGMTATTRMAARAISERRAKQEPEAIVKLQDDKPRSRLVEYYHQRQREGDDLGHGPEHFRLAQHLRDHCSDKIPGYMGHIPRVHGESIYGAGPMAINNLAANLAEDRVFNRAAHGPVTCAPQFPEARKLRM